MKYIGYGMSSSYLPHWGGWEAFREVIQNFLDFGDYEISVEYHGEDTVTICLSNDYEPTDYSFLGIGNSSKRDDSKTRGEHGEGLKMAMLVMLREYGPNSIEIRSKGESYKPSWNFIGGFGNSFQISIEDYQGSDNKFKVFMEFNSDEYENFKSNVIYKSELNVFDCSYGSIVNRPKGQIFVGGIYVTTHKDIGMAYDLPVGSVKLGRDRDIPGEFDLRWAVSRVYDKFLESDKCTNTADLMIINLNSGDAIYSNTIPSILHKHIEPVLLPSNNEDIDDEVEFKVNGKKLPDRLKSIAMGIPEIANKIQYQIKRRVNVLSLINSFYDKYSGAMNIDMQEELLKIIEVVKRRKL